MQVMNLFKCYWDQSSAESRWRWDGNLKLIQQKSLSRERGREHQIIRSPDHQNIRTSDHQIIRTSDHQNIRSSEHQIIRSSELQIIRTSELQIIRTSDHQNFRSSERQNIRSSEHQNIRTSEHGGWIVSFFSATERCRKSTKEDFKSAVRICVNCWRGLYDAKLYNRWLLNSPKFTSCHKLFNAPITEHNEELVTLFENKNRYSTKTFWI